MLKRFVITITTLIAMVTGYGHEASALTELGARTDGSTVGVGVQVLGQDGGSLGAWTPTYPEAPAGGGGGDAGWTCEYHTSAGGSDSGDDLASPAVTPEPGNEYAMGCTDASGALVYAEYVFYDPQNPLAEVLAPERALEEAYRQLVIPTPSLAASPPAGQNVVGIPTWFWLEDPWAPLSATATVGSVSATVTATPARFTVQTGDGASVTCPGPGTPWSIAADPTGHGESACSHTFQTYGPSSATATVDWDVAWTATTGDGGPLDPVQQSTAVDLRIIELQALIRA